jgi:hypothetical protein
MGSPPHHAVTEGAEVWAAVFVCHCIACAYLHPTWNIELAPTRLGKHSSCSTTKKKMYESEIKTKLKKSPESGQHPRQGCSFTYHFIY